MRSVFFPLWTVLAFFWLVSCTTEKKSEEPKDKDAGQFKTTPEKKPENNPWASLTPTVIGQHEGTVYYVGFSPDGRYLVSTGKDKLIKIWNVAGSQLIRTLQGHTADVKMADFSQDGKWLVSVSVDQTARLWDVETGKPKTVFKDKPPKKLSKEEEAALAQVPPPIMNWVAFSPDGKKIITAGDDFALKLWDVANGKKLQVFEDPGCRQRRVERRVDAPGWVSSAGCMDDGVTYLKFWNESGSPVNIQGDEDHDAHYLAFDHAGKFIIGADGSMSFTVFSAQGSMLQRVMVGTYHFSLVFGPDDKTLLIGTNGGDIYVYRPVTWNREGKIDTGERTAVEAMAVSPSDGSLVVAMRSGKILRFSTPIQ